MKKSILACCLSLSLLCGMCLMSGCGSEEKEPDTQMTATTAAVTTTADEQTRTTDSDATTASGKTTGTVPTNKTVAPRTSRTTKTVATTAGSTSGEVRKILCWGDSVTEGMSYSNDKSYPGQLQSLLGDAYQVYNSGDGGENCNTIMARQGAVKVYTTEAITFAAGEKEKVIGTAKATGLATSDGENIMLTASLGRQLTANPLTIGGKKYTLRLDNFVWNTANSPISYTCVLSRTDTDAATIAKGTQVTFASASANASAYCQIIFMGANDVGAKAAELVEKYKTMVKNIKNGKYIIIIPYWGSRDDWTKEDDALFTDAFGKHAINFRKEAMTISIASDNNYTVNGYIPPSLCLGNTIQVHLNDKGYAHLAYCIHETGKQLGYWK